MEVTHDQAGQRFVIRFADESMAMAQYRLVQGVMHLFHVYVPPQQRGGGVAAKVTTAAFEYARANGMRVVPTCPYVSGVFLPRHSEYQTLIQTNPPSG